jgi:hypothetical protein
MLQSSLCLGPVWNLDPSEPYGESSIVEWRRMMVADAHDKRKQPRTTKKKACFLGFVFQQSLYRCAISRIILKAIVLQVQGSVFGVPMP